MCLEWKRKVSWWFALVLVSLSLLPFTEMIRFLSSARVTSGGFDHSRYETQVLSFSQPRIVTQAVSLSGRNGYIPEGRDAYLLLLCLSSVPCSTSL